MKKGKQELKVIVHRDIGLKKMSKDA